MFHFAIFLPIVRIMFIHYAKHLLLSGFFFDFQHFYYGELLLAESRVY